MVSFLSVSGQPTEITNLYWSKGQIMLESQQLRDGFTSYHPKLDVVFYKDDHTRKVKTYHISTVSWIEFYDNGIHKQRKFVKLTNANRHNSKQLFELITMGDIFLLRLPHAYNYEFDQESGIMMEKQQGNKHYSYQVAYATAKEDIIMMPKKKVRAISHFISANQLDCYDTKDRRLIREYCQMKVAPELLAHTDR
ncbi:MAG: hypothetical protein ACLFUB_14155 [Cyclobacteriaceae bacterium]